MSRVYPVKKQKYRAKLEAALTTYTKILVVNIDNVGSNQLQMVRIALRGKAEVLMGKNTIIRKVIRDRLSTSPQLEALLPHIRGNTGLVFTNADMGALRKSITGNKIPAAARTGAVAPDNVYIPAGPTPLDPGQTSFFQALNIGTKITRGAIEIISKVHLCKRDEKITASAVALLNKLGIKPFFYGITILKVYDNGAIFDAAVLDITASSLKKKFVAGATQLTAICLSLDKTYNCALTVRNSVLTGYRQLLALSLASEFTFWGTEPMKAALVALDAKAAAAAAKADAKGDAKDGDKKDGEDGDKKDDAAKKDGSGSDSGSGSGSGSDSGSDSD